MNSVPTHHQWLADEGLRLLTFAKASRLPAGFGNLDQKGRLPADATAQTMNTARMTHSFAMAHIQGLPGYADLSECPDKLGRGNRKRTNWAF